MRITNTTKIVSKKYLVNQIFKNLSIDESDKDNYEDFPEDVQNLLNLRHSKVQKWVKFKPYQYISLDAYKTAHKHNVDLIMDKAHKDSVIINL